MTLAVGSEAYLLLQFVKVFKMTFYPIYALLIFFTREQAQIERLESSLFNAIYATCTINLGGRAGCFQTISSARNLGLGKVYNF